MKGCVSKKNSWTSDCVTTELGVKKANLLIRKVKIDGNSSQSLAKNEHIIFTTENIQKETERRILHPKAVNIINIE